MLHIQYLLRKLIQEYSITVSCFDVHRKRLFKGTEKP